MRAKILDVGKAGVPFHLIVNKELIIVRLTDDYENLSWTWIDNVQYALRFPLIYNFNQELWHVEEAKVIVCSGQLLHPSVRKTLFQAAFPYFEWCSCTERVQEEPEFCGGVLRLPSGRRLAVWKGAQHVDIACLNSHPPYTAPIIVAVILARIMFDHSGR